MRARPRARAWLTLGLCLAGAGSLARTARAEAAAAPPAREPRLHLALRTGFGLPLGRYASIRTLASFRDTDVNALADDTYGAIPIWLDVGYRLSARWMFGAYVMAGLVLPRTAASSDPLGGGCPDGLDCSAFGLRLGLQAQYRFAPGEPLDPWLGFGLGYEWIQSEIEGELFAFPVEASTSHAGPDLLHLQGGLDVALAERLAAGPFLSISAMRYGRCSATLSGDEVACELSEQSWHGWLVLGVRGALEL
jgi:hypothetical protein